MTTSASIHKRSLPGRFDELNRVLPLRPIDDEISLENAQEMADALALLRHRTVGQEDYLETLSTLIEKHENEHHQIDTSDLNPIEALKFLMEQNKLNSSQLGEILGQRRLGSKIPRGTRELRESHIIKLAKHFSVSPAVFVAVLRLGPR